MPDTMRNLRDISLLFLAILLITAALTALAGVQFRSDCQHDGGTFSATSTVWTCSY